MREMVFQGQVTGRLFIVRHLGRGTVDIGQNPEPWQAGAVHWRAEKHKSWRAFRRAWRFTFIGYL